MNQSLLKRAIMIANERCANYTVDDFRSFCFDRMVDEIYEELVAEEAKEMGCAGGYCGG